MSSKIKIELGKIKVECEGTEKFLKTELPDLLAAVSELYKDINSIPELDQENEQEENVIDAPPAATTSEVLKEISTSTICSKLNAKSGSDLVIASSLHLIIFKQKEVFSRSDLLIDMKSATHYYKKTYSNNLSKTITSLIKNGTLIEASNGYSLNAGKLDHLKKTLGVETSNSTTPKVVHESTNVSLVAWLKAKGSSSQTDKFLATALWLTNKGQINLKTGDVTKALRDSQQSRIGNPSDILNKNIRKGYCEKVNDGFFVTQEGKDYLK